MVSHPSFDPNQPGQPRPGGGRRPTTRQLEADPDKPLLNRPIVQTIPARARRSSWSPPRPRSTSGQFTPDSVAARPGAPTPCRGPRRTLPQLERAALRPGRPDHAGRGPGDLLQHRVRVARATSSATTPCATQAEKFGFDTCLRDADAGSDVSAFPEDPDDAADRHVGDRAVRRARHRRCRWRWSARRSPTAACTMNPYLVRPGPRPRPDVLETTQPTRVRARR